MLHFVELQGALTSKNYPFRARPWDLESKIVINRFDPFGSNLQLQLFNGAILRVLPYATTWLADTMRFFVHGLNRKRLIRNFINLDTQHFVEGRAISKNITASQTQ